MDDVGPVDPEELRKPSHPEGRQWLLGRPRKEAVVSCAIRYVSMAHQWRKQFAPSSNGALREKVNGAMAAINLFPMAHRWRNGALAAKKNRTRHGLRYRCKMMPR
jgi:hypothetical protein